MFTYSIKRAREISKFHVKWCNDSKEMCKKAWCTCKVAVCYLYVKTYTCYFSPFFLPSLSSLVLLSSRNSATMVTWRHTSPLYKPKKQQTFRYVITGLPAKWRLGNERRNSIITPMLVSAFKMSAVFPGYGGSAHDVKLQCYFALKECKTRILAWC